MANESRPADAPGSLQSKPSFEAVVQHWAKARIDGPMQVIARFDEAAKQLIATGSLLQGVFFAVVALGKWKNDFPFPLWIVDRIALVKHRWLLAANLLFLASSVLTLAMLLGLGWFM
jgi:hypothetical protein